MAVLAVDTIKIGDIPTSDPNAVHKWEPWDDDINVTGTGRFPFLEAGSMELPYELTLAGFENLITGIFALVNSTDNKYGFTSMVTSDDIYSSIPAGLFLNYGTHSGNGGSSLLGVWRFCNLTGTGLCNTGPLADFGDLSNTMFPNAALSISSDAPASGQILRLNGYLLDEGSKMIYLANTNNTMAVYAENSAQICTNLNADMVDSKHAADFVAISGDQYITGNLGLSDNMTADYFIGDGSLLTGMPIPPYVSYANDSDKVDGKHSTDFLWLDGSQNMTGPLNLGVDPLTAYSSLRFSVKDGNNYLFENETGDIRLLLSDKGQFYLYDFLQGYGSGKSMNLMHLGDNAYIGSTDGILLDPSNLKTTVTGNLTADYHLGDGRYLTNLPKALNATYSDTSGNSDALDTKHSSDFLAVDNNGIAQTINSTLLPRLAYRYDLGALASQTTLTATEDSYVLNGASADTNYGTSDPINAGGYTYGDYNILYVRFSTTTIPSWCNATNAVLKLYKPGVGDSTFYLHRITANWNETGVTFNNRPTQSGSRNTGEYITPYSWPGNPAGWAYFNVTDWYSNMLRGVYADYGFSMDGMFANSFTSREGTNKPVLIVDCGSGIWNNTYSYYFQGAYKSDDGSLGLTNTTGFWMCKDSGCATTCQAQIKNGLIVGCT
jgi:hypothetical protein